MSRKHSKDSDDGRDSKRRKIEGDSFDDAWDDDEFGSFTQKDLENLDNIISQVPNDRLLETNNNGGKPSTSLPRPVKNGSHSDNEVSPLRNIPVKSEALKSLESSTSTNKPPFWNHNTRKLGSPSAGYIPNGNPSPAEPRQDAQMHKQMEALEKQVFHFNDLLLLCNYFCASF